MLESVFPADACVVRYGPVAAARGAGCLLACAAIIAYAIVAPGHVIGHVILALLAAGLAWTELRKGARREAAFAVDQAGIYFGSEAIKDRVPWRANLEVIGALPPYLVCDPPRSFSDGVEAQGRGAWRWTRPPSWCSVESAPSAAGGVRHDWSSAFIIAGQPTVDPRRRDGDRVSGRSPFPGSGRLSAGQRARRPGR